MPDENRDFLKSELPDKGDKDEPDQKKRKEFNAEQKKRRYERIEQFVKPGSPGVKFKKIFDKMLTRLELPKHVKEQLGISQAPTGEKVEAPKVRFSFFTA